MTKPLPYDALMSLDEKEIGALFPEGAQKVGSKWKPAESEKSCDRTLKQLLKDKKRRRDTPRLLAQDSTRGYTDQPYLAVPREPEAVDEVTQHRLSQEARGRFDEGRQDELIGRQAKVIAAKIAKVQREGAQLGLDFGPQLQAMIRQAQAEIVRLRREAA